MKNVRKIPITGGLFDMENKDSFRSALSRLMIERVPGYANRFLYSLGFLSMLCFISLVITGVTMVFFGPMWWLSNRTGIFVRSIHLWSMQAFAIFVVLHLLIVFFTSGFRKPRRSTWVLGAITFFFVLLEGEFGYVLRGDFSSQWRSLQGADLYNGTGIGAVLNSLNYQQIYGIHVALVPFVILTLLFFHYLLVKVRGIAEPYRKDVPYKVVPANHKILFLRGLVLVFLLVFLAVIFPSPFIHPTTVQDIAKADQKIIGATLAQEFNKSSDTATYIDNIDPYTFDTRSVYIDGPYKKLISSTGAKDMLQVYDSESKTLQSQQLKAAVDYYSGDQKTPPDLGNPVTAVINSLVPMAKTGLYEGSLITPNESGDKSTYVTRFLADTGVLDDKATSLGITTEQYGMLREESKSFPLGAWWLAPIGLLDHTILANDENGDRDGAIILGCLLLLLIALPYIPYLNRLPDKLKLYRLIWRDNK